MPAVGTLAPRLASRIQDSPTSAATSPPNARPQRGRHVAMAPQALTLTWLTTTRAQCACCLLPVVWFIFRRACCWLHEHGLLHRTRKRVSRPPSGPCACVHQQPAVHRLRQQSLRRRLLCAVRTDPSVRRELSAPETHRCLPSPSIAPCVATVLPATLIVAHRARCNGVALPCLALPCLAGSPTRRSATPTRCSPASRSASRRPCSLHSVLASP